MALTQFMSKGSEVFVKVNRTRSGLPFAHVQYLVGAPCDIGTPLPLTVKRTRALRKRCSRQRISSYCGIASFELSKLARPVSLAVPRLACIVLTAVLGFLYVGYRDEATARPTGSQMRDLFSNFEIESVRESTAEEMEDSRLDNCVVVHFAKWGECGEAFRVDHHSSPVFSNDS
jgi:hypothetical protein